MALTSSSTLSDALAQFNNNLIYDGNATKTEALLEAIRWLLGNRPIISQADGNKVDFIQLESMERTVSQHYQALSSTRRGGFVRGQAVDY